jgi:glycosyltransferase involved in cell wall biosynthesis
MASGVPILACAPAQTAISEFLLKHNCGHCLTELEPKKIEEAIQVLANNVEYRSLLSSNAINVAFEKFDAKKVRAEFQALISNPVKKTINL